MMNGARIELLQITEGISQMNSRSRVNARTRAGPGLAPTRKPLRVLT